VSTLLLGYIAGVLLGLWRVDSSPSGRLVLALLWPVGVVAAVTTTVILLVAAAVLFPLVGAILVGMAFGGWWIM